MDAVWRLRLSALLLSVSVHLGLGMVVGMGSGEGRTLPQSSVQVLTVQLAGPDKQPDKLVSASSLSSPSSPDIAASSGPSETPLSAAVPSPPPPRRNNAPALVPLLEPAEPRYFRLSELTQKPLVLQDVSSELQLDMPGVAPQPVILRLFINTEGEIDKVTVEDSHLPEQAERRVIDTFSTLRFQPGKIGRISVRSQLRIEVILVTTLQNPERF